VVLQTHDLTVRFGAVVAVDGVDLSIRAGEVVGLIGANGAGKTTLVDAVSGFVPYDGGVVVDGRAVDDLSAFRRARAGMARTWQSLELFADLTVRENLEVAADHKGLPSMVADLVWPGRARRGTDPSRALALMGLADLADASPAELSLGTQKLVNVARALVSGPRVLLLDEPAAGLSTAETIALGTALRAAMHGAVGVLLIEHDVSLVFDICDRVYVLDRGRVIAEGTPAAVRADPEVVAAYLGTATPGGSDDGLVPASGTSAPPEEA
jgi:branched-chain amino acid transport system ATP-binding protein